MSLYFILSEEDYNGKTEDIGNVLDKYLGALHKDTGLSLNSYLGPSREEIMSYYQTQNYVPMLEEVLWKNMTDDEKAQKMRIYLNKINITSEELIVIDPYIFFKPNDNYRSLLLNILSGEQFKKIRFITDDKNVDIGFYNSISAKLSAETSIYYSKDFHDRYWVANREKGFTLGTSLNGLGKKYCSIQYMDNEDVSDIIKIATSLL